MKYVLIHQFKLTSKEIDKTSIIADSRYLVSKDESSDSIHIIVVVGYHSIIELTEILSALGRILLHFLDHMTHGEGQSLVTCNQVR